METLQPLYGDQCAPEQAFSSLSQSNTHRGSTDPCPVEHLNPEEPNAEVTDAPHRGFQPASLDPGPSVSSNTRPSSPAHVHNTRHPPNRLHVPTPVHQETAPPLNIKPVALFADMNPSFHIPHVYPHIMPHFNPSWPVLVPHLGPSILSNASGPRHNPLCPLHAPQPFRASFSALVACEEPCSRVFGAHLNVCSARAPHLRRIGTEAELQECFRRWQRLAETARPFCSSGSDAEALACFFTRVLPSLSVHRPDLPFSAAVNAAVHEWRNISVSERQTYYNTARMFTETEKQDKSTNRDPTTPQTDKRKGPHPQGKKTGKGSKKGVQGLAEGALAEYSQLMDALESKVSDGSEVTAAEEEDVCALFLNQLLDDTTEAGLDMDYISSLLSADDAQDTLPRMTPEPVAGCSDWTSEAQILPRSAVQQDYSASDGTNHMMENVSAPVQDNISVFQTLTQPLLLNHESQSSQTDPNVSVQETPHPDPDLQDFSAEVDGNQKDVAELDSTTPSNCFSLQNYNSHHATFPKHDPEPPKTPVDEHDGEKNTVVGQKTEKCMHVGRAKDNNNMDSDTPVDSQRTRSVCTTQTVPNIQENNLHKNKKHKRRRKHQKITLPVARTSPKLDDKDERRLKMAENGLRKTQRKSAMKHRAQETDSEIMKKAEIQQRVNRAETRSSHDAQIRKTRGEHLEDEFERRLKTVRRDAEQRTATSRKTAKLVGRRGPC